MKKSLVSPFHSLSTKLSVGIILFAVPVFLVSLGFLFQQSRKMVRREATERANSTLNATLQRLNRHLMAVETATNVSDWQVPEYLDPDTLLAVSRRVVRLNPHIDGCSISAEPYVFPKYGRYFSAYSVREGDSITTVIEKQYEYFEKIWYKKPRELRKACWVDFFDEIDSLELTIAGRIASYGKPLYNDSGKLVAIISTDLSLQHLSKLVTAEKPYPNSYFAMLGEDGTYFIHPDTAKLFKQTIFTDQDAGSQADLIALGHEMTSGRRGSVQVNINGEPCLVCYQPIRGTAWSLALICPDSDILRGYHQLTYILIPLLIFGLVVIFLLISHVVGHSIRPLNRLLEQTQNIAGGNYEVHIPQSPRKDVVGRLQNSFATMLQSLNFHMGSIRYMADQTKKRNEELVKATKIAEEADRQKTTFMQNMTHQIRTPLNIIMGFAQVIRDTQGQLPEEEMRSVTEMMDHNAKTLNRMVLMLFDSSDSGLNEELNSHKDEVVPVNDVVRESIAFTHEHFPNLPVKFETELPDSFCIRTSRLYLMRSLRELLYNSAKYSDGQHVSVRITSTDTTVRFVFEDTGPGISEDYYDYIFVLFTKVNDLSEGLGLGLPLAKRHVVNLGGDLIFDPDYHDGCRFMIELPI